MLVKDVEAAMSNNIEQVFLLEQVLKIVDMGRQDNKSLGKLKENISDGTFELDYVQLEVLKKKIGDIGEQYVYEREKARLEQANSEFAQKVDNTPAKDNRNGYDILSYTENGTPIYIEVKSTMGDLETPFYITANEKKTAEQIREGGGIYQIHRVYHVGKDIDVFVYEDDSLFVYDDVLYCVSTKKEDK